LNWWDKEVEDLCAVFGYYGLVELLTGRERAHPLLFEALRRNAPKLAAKYPKPNARELLFLRRTVGGL
jgi:hypothetical protein